MKGRQLWAWVILAATVAFALAPLYRRAELSVPLHHLFHVVLLVGAAISALLLASPPVPPLRGRASWLILAIVSPLLAMFLMWPSDYSVFERSPMLHVAEHLGLVACGFLTGYAGRRYAAGIGIVMSSCLWLMGLLAIGGYGVSPPPRVPALSQTPGPLPASSETAASNVAHGAAIFQQNCAACHGAHAQGGIGPSLLGESARKNFRQAMTWIENPAPPMPKLYPQTLSRQDVRDVAAYVESLK